MRLLPDQKRADGRRTVASLWSDHLGPTRAHVALLSGQFTRARQNRLIPAETSFEQRQTIPQSEVRSMPPMHLQMKLAVPTVDSQPCLLRRFRPGALNGREVLRENDAPLQFSRAMVAARGQLDCAALCPKASPVFAARGKRRRHVRQRFAQRMRRECRDELKTRALLGSIARARWS